MTEISDCAATPMKLHQTKSAGINIIRSWAANKITINEKVFSHSLIIAGERIIEDWQHSPPLKLNESDFDQALALEPELIVLGTGQKLVFPDQRLIWAFQSRGVGFEIMDTGAACRTYNILAAEDRNVVAALIVGELVE